MRKIYIIWIVWFLVIFFNSLNVVGRSGMNFINYPLESITTFTGAFMWFIIPFVIWYYYDKFRKKKEDYVHIKDANMIMGQLEKWGKKKKK